MLLIIFLIILYYYLKKKNNINNEYFTNKIKDNNDLDNYSERFYFKKPSKEVDFKNIAYWLYK